MPMGTDKNKTKQRPYKQRDPADHTPPRLRTEEREMIDWFSSHTTADRQLF